MTIRLVGLNHADTPVEVRERFAVPEGELPEVYELLASAPSLLETVILSTCNRTEIYALCDEPGGREVLDACLVGRAEGEWGRLKRHFYHLEGTSAVTHLFRVASGLDSMIVGEGQILGQIRKAFEAAREHKAIGPYLDRCFRGAIRCGKRARSETGISRGASSIGMAALSLIRNVLPDLQGRRVLAIGAGKMVGSAVKLLKNAGLHIEVIANRTYANAQHLAHDLDARAIYLSELSGHLERVDVVVSCTGAPHLILKRPMVEEAMAKRAGQPLVLIDLAVPRDIDPAAASIPGVHLHNVDDLKIVVRDQLNGRRDEIEAVERIIREEADRFAEYLASMTVTPVLIELREMTEELRRAAIRHLNGALPPEQRVVVEEFSRILMQKFLHQPLSKIKEFAQDENVREKLLVIKEIFNLGVSLDCEGTEPAPRDERKRP